MWKHRIILTVFSVLLPAVAGSVQPEGIVFEAEAISTPRSAWLDNRSDDTHWNLWTREQDIDKKRSGGAVLASPAVKADRATPDHFLDWLQCLRSGKPTRAPIEAGYLHSVVGFMAVESYRNGYRTTYDPQTRTIGKA